VIGKFTECGPGLLDRHAGRVGDLRRVDPTRLPDRQLVDLDSDEGRGVYIVTEQGRERAQSLGR